MSKAIKAIAGAGVVLGLCLPVNAVAKDDLQAQVDKLGKQVAELQKQLNNAAPKKKVAAKKSKKVELKTIMIANNRILVFLKNSYILKFNLKGEMIDIIKLPTKINSKPIFIDSSLLYLDKNNKLSIVN